MSEIIKGYPLSAFQTRTWYWQQHSDFTEYRVNCRLAIQGLLDFSKLINVVNSILNRYEIFRTNFRCIPGLEVPLQVVNNTPISTVKIIDLTQRERFSQEDEINSLITRLKDFPIRCETDPLLIVLLFVLDKDDYLLYLTAHPLVADTETMVCLIRCILRAYSGDSDAGDSDDESDILQYTDFASGHNAMLQNGELAEEQSFWSSCRNLAPTELTMLFCQSATQPFTWQQVRVPLDRDTVQAIKQLGDELNVSLGDIGYVALRALMARITNQQSFTIGLVSDVRPLMGLENVPGPMTQVLPDRGDVLLELSFFEMVKQASVVLKRLRQNQSCLALELQEAPSVSFVNVAFLSEKKSSVSWKVQELTNLSEGTQVQLRIIAINDGLELEANFAPETYATSNAKHFLERWRILLASATANPLQAMYSHNILFQQERHQLLCEFNNTSSPYHSSTCVQELFAMQAKRTPSQTAIKFNEKRLSYNELAADVQRLASKLVNRGVNKGDRVGIFLTPTMEMITSLLAVFTVGAAYVPVDPDEPEARISYIFKDSAVKLVLTKQHLLEQLPHENLDTFNLDLELNEKLDFHGSDQRSFTPVYPDDIAYVMYTSGSTGQPKGVAITHKSLANYLCWINENILVDPVQILPAVTKLSFDACLKQLFAPLLKGGEVWLISRETVMQPRALLEAISKYEGVGLNCVPSLWAAMLREIEANQFQLPASSLVSLFLGGETLTEKLVNTTFKLLPHLQIWNFYGPTETTATASATRVFANQEVTIGKPIANTQIYILDAYLNPVLVGTPAEIYIGGAGVSVGYFGRPQLTAERFINNPFSNDPQACIYKTGDLGCWTPDGLIKYLGRLDNQVKIRGYRIELGEIELALNRFEGVRECAVIVVSNNVVDKQLVAYIVGQSHLSFDSLRAFLRQTLPEYMIPSRFLMLKELPRLSNGKLDRVAIHNADLIEDLLVAPYIAPRTFEEIIIANIWREILKVEQVGVDDDFFQLGGHSLLAAQTINRLQTAFSVEVPLRQIFETPTVASLATAIAQRKTRQRNMEFSQIQVAPQGDKDIEQLLAEIEPL